MGADADAGGATATACASARIFHQLIFGLHMGGIPDDAVDGADALMQVGFSSSGRRIRCSDPGLSRRSCSPG